MQELTERKNNVRRDCKKRRIAMERDEKKRADSIIYDRTWDIIRTRLDMETVLYFYVSSPEMEVDTLRLIDKAFGNKIMIAVPRCVTGTLALEHYFINDRSQLIKGHFGIMEPDPQKCSVVSPPHEGICIVPGLAFDITGIRMGYGKGYYDRFLEKFSGLKIGLCYENCFYTETLPHDEHDAVMDLIITDKKVRQIKKIS